MDENNKDTSKKETKGKKSGLVIVIAVVLVLVVAGGFLYKKFVVAAKNKILSSILSGGTNQNVKVDTENESVTLKGDGYEISVDQSGELSDKFPSDFPVYKDAKITTQAQTQGDENEGMTVIWETPDEVAKVSEYFKKELTGSNWKIESSFESGDSTVYNLKKGADIAFLSITRTEDKTEIMFTTGKEE